LWPVSFEFLKLREPRAASALALLSRSTRALVCTSATIAGGGTQRIGVTQRRGAHPAQGATHRRGGRFWGVFWGYRAWQGVFMERPIRPNAGVAAAHFSQDESLYVGRKRPAYFEACSRCQVAHRSEKERERCLRAGRDEVCPHCQVAHRSEKERERCRRAGRDEVCPHCQVAHRSEKKRERCRKSNAGVHCQHCGGSHK
jgi:hypothetical protein